MNSEQFKALELEQQVEYVNSQLRQGNTVDNIRTTLGVGKNYIGTNFKKGGYVKDKATGLYIKVGTEATITTNTTIEKAQNANNKALSGSNNSNSLEKRVKSLEKQIEAITTMLEANNTNTTVTTNEIEIKKFEGEKVARSYKVNIEVQKQFKAFCKAHSEYEVGDILATAMLEFMNKFK